MFLAEVCLLTNDVLRLAEFYKVVLNTTSDCDDEAHQVILINGAGATLTIYNDGKEKNNSNQNICIAFTVEDVDFEYERLNDLESILLSLQ